MASQRDAGEPLKTDCLFYENLCTKNLNQPSWYKFNNERYSLSSGTGPASGMYPLSGLCHPMRFSPGKRHTR